VYLGGGSTYVASLLRKRLVKIQMFYTLLVIPLLTFLPCSVLYTAHREAADLHPPQSVAPQPPSPQPPMPQIVDWAAIRASIPEELLN